jgi:hypothetical protein
MSPVHATLTEMPVLFLTETENKNPKIHMEARDIQTAKRILNRKGKAVGTSVPDFKLYYKAIVTKITAQQSIG